jgi:hypothetical protein
VSDVEPACEVRVRVQPRASRSEVARWDGEVLAVRLTAPPVEHAANRACRQFLADLLGLRPAGVTLVAGHRSRTKRFRVVGLTADALRARLARLLQR